MERKKPFAQKETKVPQKNIMKVSPGPSGYSASQILDLHTVRHTTGFNLQMSVPARRYKKGIEMEKLCKNITGTDLISIMSKSKSEGVLTQKKKKISELRAKSEGTILKLRLKNESDQDINDMNFFIAQSIYTLKNLKTQLFLKTYRPVKCPMEDCKRNSCPSDLLSHILCDHGQVLPGSELRLDGSISTASIPLYRELKPFTPTPLHLFIVSSSEYPDFPILLNGCRLGGSYPCWIAFWITSLYITPMWFRMQLQTSNDFTPTTISYICKIIELHETLPANNLALSENVMIVNEKTLEVMSHKEKNVHIKINSFPRQETEVEENSTEVSIASSQCY